MLSQHSEIRVLLDAVATQLKSVRSSTIELYRACLRIYCPDHASADKSSQDFQRAIIAMEKDIVAELMQRDCDVKVAKRYLSGCYQTLICGSEKFNLNLLSTQKKQRIAEMVQAGKSFEEAYRESGERHRDKEETKQGIWMRPPLSNESVAKYAETINEELKKFLANYNLTFTGEIKLRKVATNIKS